MKKILMFIFALLAFTFPLGSNAFADEPLTVRVVYSNANIYKEADSSTRENIIDTVTYNTRLSVLEVVDKTQSVDGFEYFKVEYTKDEYTFGYVLKSQVVDASINSPQKRLDTNAKIVNECYVYNLNGSNYEQTEDKLEVGTKIKILSGYNKENEYTQIQYQTAEGDIVTAYIKTSALKTTALSKSLISAILLIITSVSLVLLIFGVSGKKKKRKAQKA